MPAAATLASICSGFVAPAITEATSGCDVCQLIARSSRVWPALVAPRDQPLDDGELVVVDEGRGPVTPRRQPRVLPAGPRPAGTCPVSNPDSSGKYGTNAIPSSAHASNTPSVSGSRVSRL